MTDLINSVSALGATAPVSPAEEVRLMRLLLEGRSLVRRGGELTPAEHAAAVDGRYRMVAEGADDVVLETDRTGHVLWVSDSITSSGWSPQRLLGTALGDLLAERDRDVVADIHARVLGGETVSGVIVRMLTADGRIRFISTTARPARDQQAQVTGAVVGWHDVDEVARAHQALQARRSLAQHLVTGCVAQGVVDFLEVVQIQAQHREAATALPVALYRVGQRVAEAAAVQGTAQPVVPSHVAHAATSAHRR